MDNDLAIKIKTLRLERNMTLEEVATIVGVGKSTVRKWETGMIANMKRDKIALLAKALGTTPAYLMGWKEVTSTPASPDVMNLTKEEAMLVQLFRQIPTEAREMYLEVLRQRVKNLS